jgi:hypothetical protein
LDFFPWDKWPHFLQISLGIAALFRGADMDGASSMPMAEKLGGLISESGGAISLDTRFGAE